MFSTAPRPAKRKRKNPHGDDDAGLDDVENAPALSHAEQRRQRKRAKLALQDPQDEPAPTKRKPGAVEHRAPRKNSVWVGNLSFKTTLGALRAFFADAGEVVRINMPTKPGSEEVRGSVRAAVPAAYV
jgi:hypothetical protein